MKGNDTVQKKPSVSFKLFFKSQFSNRLACPRKMLF